jgi:ABC-type bacteriocin/lantibiotic exporter with double-glycine peptidase domain
MIKVVCEVEPYEMNGQEFECKLKSKKPLVKVESHWNRNEFVVLKFGNNDSFTVVASDLETAIRNATNSSRF